MKNILAKVLLVFISVVFTFGVVEVYVRLYNPQEVAPVRYAFDPQLGDVNAPNQKGRRIRLRQFNHTFSNNSIGLRGSKEYRLERTTEHRILFLGDSFTYGHGVNDDQTFAYLTERELLAKNLSVEAMNFGTSGKGTDFELKFFQVVGQKYHPDLTVLCFTANDYIDNERGEYYAVSPTGEITPKPLKASRGIIKTVLHYLPGYNWLISWSQAANLLKEAGVKWFLKTTDPIALKEGALVIAYPTYQQGYARESNKRDTAVYIKQLMKSVREASGSLLIMYVPVSKEVADYRQSQKWSHDEVATREIVQQLGGKLISVTPVLAGTQLPVDKLYFPLDGHWTALGHAVVARYLAEEIGREFDGKAQVAGR